MTDELLYERLAMSVSQLGSPLPHVHGELLPNLNQLYPLLIAPAFSGGLVPGSLDQAHALNAWIMSSACIPAFLLARRVTGRRLLRVRAGGADGVPAVDRALVVPAHGGRGLPRIPLGRARDPGGDRLAVAAQRRAGAARDRPRGVRADAVRAAADRAAGRAARRRGRAAGSACGRRCAVTSCSPSPMPCSCWAPSCWPRSAASRACSGRTAARSRGSSCPAESRGRSSSTPRRWRSGSGSCRSSSASPGCSRTWCVRPTASRTRSRASPRSRSPRSRSR